MNCWHCNHQLIWGGDNDCDDDCGEQYIETNLSCPECGSYVLVYLKVAEQGQELRRGDNES